jgi:hypothetical protein
LSIPIGSANGFAPGPADRGQPTLFQNRLHRQVFNVKVPGNWGRTQELTWTVVANGVALKAVGWLQADWEIDAENAGQIQSESARANKPPTVVVEAPAKVSAGDRVPLSASVADDGLPAPRPKAAPIAGVNPPTLLANPADPEIPVNVPQVVDPGRGPRRGSAPIELTVAWIVWRGPANAIFDPRSAAQVKDGKAVVNATFKQPGTYVLRAVANDGAKSSDARELSITVTP